MAVDKYVLEGDEQEIQLEGRNHRSTQHQADKVQRVLIQQVPAGITIKIHRPIRARRGPVMPKALIHYGRPGGAAAAAPRSLG